MVWSAEHQQLEFLSAPDWLLTEPVLLSCTFAVNCKRQVTNPVGLYICNLRFAFG